MDSETLLTALNHLHGQLKRTAFTPHLLDEEAPVSMCDYTSYCV